ncbi:MAG: molybdopterin molybdenumtransferase MoeA [Candidatus Omnitrophota bacterium]|jgi:molybdopterin molybdotransferase|nr:MAG: molybdopterin molybdenumtransferase MoeA [Candidatus Omnitrophota bacterium]
MNPPLLTYGDALQCIFDHIRPLPAERVGWLEALGATLAEDVFAREGAPLFDNSGMDGFAVRSEDVQHARPDSPVRLQILEDIHAGATMPRRELMKGCAAKIMTGAPLPPGADAVVIVERTRQENDQILIFNPVPSGEHVRKKNEEIQPGAKILQEGTLIGSVERGLLALQGLSDVLVRKHPRVAVLATGDELVQPDEAIQGGQIRNVNTYTLAAELQSYGCPFVDLGIGRDNRIQLRTLIESGLRQAPVLLTSGGVSAGEKDYLPAVLQDLGMKTIFHKVSVKPGKPLLFGKLDECVIFGLPGNVVSGVVSFHVFVKPALRLLAGRKDWHNPVWYVRWGGEPEKSIDRTHFIRCRLRHTPTGLPIAFPTGRQGSGMLSSLAGADGFAVVPSDIDCVEEFTVLEFIPVLSK